MEEKMEKKYNHAEKYELFNKRWLSPDDVEFEYGFSKSTLAKMRMAKNGSTLPFSKVTSKLIRYDRIILEQWLEEHTIKNNEKCRCSSRGIEQSRIFSSDKRIRSNEKLPRFKQ